MEAGNHESGRSAARARQLAKAGWKVDVILSHDVYASHPLANTYELELERYEADQVQQLEFWKKSVRRRTTKSGFAAITTRIC